MFVEWMLSCGHQIGCAVHDQARPAACDCSAQRGDRAVRGNPRCAIPHLSSSPDSRSIWDNALEERQ